MSHHRINVNTVWSISDNHVTTWDAQPNWSVGDFVTVTDAQGWPHHFCVTESEATHANLVRTTEDQVYQ